MKMWKWPLLAVSAAFCIILMIRVGEADVKLLLLLCYLAGIVLMAVWGYCVKKEVIKFAQKMDVCMDQMIAGEEEIFFEENEETLLSKLQTKLGKLYEVQKEYGNANAKERQKIQELVSDISHQTKTPVANLRMYTDILKDRNNDEQKQQEFLECIRVQTDKLDFLMKSMVKMSRLETGILKIKKSQVPFSETIKRAVGSVLPKAEKKKIAVFVDIDEDIILYHDSKWTEEAIYNVLDNAVKYTNPGGSIWITAVLQEFYTKMSVRDSGKGIETSRQAAVFKRFYREPEVHDKEGIGIGLYLTREILTRQDGFIEVKSETGKGSEFLLYLPNEPETKKEGLTSQNCDNL